MDDVDLHLMLDGPSYSNEGLVQIVGACRAAAYHNITKEYLSRKFVIGEDPFLCDELSIWERFPASSTVESTWKQENFLESGDISIDKDVEIVKVILHGHYDEQILSYRHIGRRLNLSPEDRERETSLH